MDIVYLLFTSLCDVLHNLPGCVLFMHAPVYHDINNYADIESMNKLQGLYPCSVISSYQKNEDIN